MEDGFVGRSIVGLVLVLGLVGGGFLRRGDLGFLVCVFSVGVQLIALGLLKYPAGYLFSVSFFPV